MASQGEISRRRVTFNQLESLWEFLNSHRDVAVGYNKSAQAREHSKRMWTSVAERLNSMGGGATKDWKGWSNYWIDYKAKLKRRVACIRTAQNRTGGGPSEAIPLNEAEKKFLSILGDDFGCGLPNTQVDPFPILTQPEPAAPIECPPIEESPLIEGLVVESHDSQHTSHHTTPHHSITPHHDVEQLVQQGAPQPQAAEGTSSRVQRRRSRRQVALSQQMAREMLVNISRDRLLAEQQNSVSLTQIAEALQRNTETLQAMLVTVNSIASVIDKNMGSRGPQTRDECAPDT